MIHYVAKSHRALRQYLEDWAPGMRARMRLLTYDDLAGPDDLPEGTYVFADVELLSPPQAREAARVWEELASRPGTVLLNHPLRTMGRYELLRALADRGLNRFRAYRLDEVPPSPRFPVFLRHARRHTGSLTPLIHDADELERWILKGRIRGLAEGFRLRDLLLVEFCDASGADGTYRKYAAFVVGERILPRHLFVSRGWMVKFGDSDFDRTSVDEERRYLEGNPHAETLRRVARIARLDYGRIDYGVVDGHVQVWEANTHPTVVSPRTAVPEHRRPFQERFLAALEEALSDVDGGPSGGSGWSADDSERLRRAPRPPGAIGRLPRRLRRWARRLVRVAEEVAVVIRHGRRRGSSR